tara:strand:+ start:78 stop:614 length:537 start_codon:yes stop_codon:yes gene_type:complete
MRKDIFAIPIFEFEVDLKFINIPVKDEDFRPTWESRVPSSFVASRNAKIPKPTLHYLSDKILECLRTLKDPVTKISIDGIWKNKYDVSDFQGYHTHSNTTWSFIVYEDVEESKTQFINPSMSDIQNHSPLGRSDDMPVMYMPKLKSGWMILFPSWLPHQVLSGNSGTTISGNITCYVD